MRRLVTVAAAFSMALALGGVHPAATGSTGPEEIHAHQHADHGVMVSQASVGTPAGVSTPLAPSENVSYVTGSHFTGSHVAIEGKRLYVGAYGVGVRIFDIRDPKNPVLIGGYLPGGRADAVPDAAEYGDRHLAVLNGTRRVTSGGDEVRTDKSEFLDVTDAANPVLLHRYVGPEHGEAHNGDIIDERRLWLPSGGTAATGGLRIYDLGPTITTAAEKCRPTAKDNPCTPPQIFVGNPVELWSVSPYRDGRPLGPKAFTHTHDISGYTDFPVRQEDGTTELRDIILLAEGGSYLNDSGNTGSVFVIDITNPRDPIVLQRWLHERGPDHHPIRYTHEAQLLDGDPSVMLVTDEDLHHPCGEGDGGPVDTAGGGAVAVRLSPDLTEATELSEWFIPLGTPAPVCSVHVFSSHENFVFFGSYNAGLQVVDYSDPEAPEQAGFYIAEGATAWGAQYHKHGIVYQGDMSRGLDVLLFEPLAKKGKGPRGQGQGGGPPEGRGPNR